MSKRNGMFGASFAVPVIVAIVILIAIAIFSGSDDMKADGREFYEITGLSVTADSGSMTLGNGSYIAPGMILNFTAENESTPGDSNDQLVVDLNITDGGGDHQFSTTLALNYSGAGDDFWGDLLISNDMDSDYSQTPIGLQINVSNGYMVHIKKHDTDMAWMKLYVDTQAPVIGILEDPSEITEYQGIRYATTSSTLNLDYTDVDPNSTSAWAITNGKVKYNWNGGSEQTWDGTDFAIPSATGDHILRIKASDSFDQSRNYSYRYSVATTITDTYISDPLEYENETLLSPSIEILEGGSLDLKNCTTLMLDGGDSIVVRSGGYLNITGPVMANAGNQSILGTSEDGMSLITMDGSNFLASHTDFSDSDTSVNPATMILDEGSVRHSDLSGPNTVVMIRSIGVEIDNTTINGNNTDCGILIDVNHTFDDGMTRLTDLNFIGTFGTPIKVMNNSIFKPFDVDQMYYIGDGNVTMSFFTPTADAGYSDPYLYLPHFLDSRSTESELYITYNNSGTWEMIPGSHRSNVVFNNWTNGEDARIDLSSLPPGARVNVTFNASDNGMGRLYTGAPYMGGSNMDPVRIDPLHFGGDVSRWLSNPVNSDTLLIRNVTMENASDSFIGIRSSGLMKMEKISNEMGSATPEASVMIDVEYGSFKMNGSDLTGYEDLNEYITLDMGSENDYPLSSVSNISLDAADIDVFYGVDLRSTWFDISHSEIFNVTNGVRAQYSFVNTKLVTVSPSSYGMDIHFPEHYPKSVELSLMNLTVNGNYGNGALNLNGDIDYDMAISLTNANFASTHNSTVFDRGDGYGAVAVDLISSGEASLHFDGIITNGPWHGIAVNSWPDTGQIEIIRESRISNMDLDGIWMDDDADLIIEQAVEISSTEGWGIYGYQDSNITLTGRAASMVNIRNNEMGGILVGDDSSFSVKHATISTNGGHAILLGEDVSASIENTFCQTNKYGLRSPEGSTIMISSSTIKDTLSGHGINVKGSDLTITGSEGSRSIIEENFKNGLFVKGGTLSLNYTLVKSNVGGDGIELWGVNVIHFNKVTVDDNGADGLSAHVDDPSLLSVDREYMTISYSRFQNNDGRGIIVTYDPTAISEDIEMTLTGVRIYGNKRGDIISDKEIHYQWNMVGSDQIGDSGQRGFTRANLDITVMNDKVGQIINEEIQILNNNREIRIQQLGRMFIEDSSIRCSLSTNTWSFTAEPTSRVRITGTYMRDVQRMEISEAVSFTMRDSRFSNSPDGIALEKTQITIENCVMEDIEGSALSLYNSTGKISGSHLKNNVRGLLVDGLVGELSIDDSFISKNQWGVYVFSVDHNASIGIMDSNINNNDIAPIWTNANITLEDTDVDPSAILVNENGISVSIYYTLTLNVLNEESEPQTFNVILKKGESPSNLISNNNQGTWSHVSRSYLVTDNGVDRSLEFIRVTISYIQSPDNQTDLGYIKDSLYLDTETTMTYYGFDKPRTVDNRWRSLDAWEDQGLDGGAVDISEWFTDTGDDRGNLTYEVESLTEQIRPVLVGSILSVELEENWNGKGEILITVRDPHGKELTVSTEVRVASTNDLPWITDAVILVKDGEDNIPRTGDDITAEWTWHDIDENDNPRRLWIEWYLNGSKVEDLSNRTTVTNVKYGQTWSYKVWPSDFKSEILESGVPSGFGEPVRSESVTVENIGPVWTSDLSFNTRNPKSDTDITIKPGTYHDPDSSLITFNYLWEVRSGNEYVPLGAPNSPVLDSRFTSKHQDIRVKVWLSDGVTSSKVRIADFEIRNSPPSIVSARISPKIVREDDELITITDFVTRDIDGDPVTLYYEWRVGDISVPVNNEVPYLSKTTGAWSYPGRSNITVIITCFDSENAQGDSLTLNANFIPTDTDGDGQFDDANGDGENDPGDDHDDDNDGFQDEWEEELGTDPLDPLSKPLDTDGDGRPDGDPSNSMNWMDRDDDEDGIPDSEDSYPKNGALPGDLDGDGIGNDLDNDIDGDGTQNDDDYDPYNPNVQNPPEKDGQSPMEILILIILVIIIIAIGIGVYSVATGAVKLPTTAPPAIEGEEGDEAIFEEDIERPESKDDIEELEDVDNMSVCSVCGELVSMDVEKCPNCGAAFDDMEEKEEDEDMDFEMDYED